MRKAFLITFFISISVANAQSVIPKTCDKKSSSWVGISSNYYDFTNLNKKISQYNNLYENTPKFTFGLHYGIESNLPKSFTKLQFSLNANKKGNASKKNTSLLMLDFGYDFGYKIIDKNNFTVAPFLGAGINTAIVTFRKDLSAITIDSLFTSSTAQQYAESIKLKNSFFCLRSGIAFTFLDRKDQNPTASIVLGYNMSFKNSAWKYNDEQVLLNSPADKLNMFYISLQFCSAYNTINCKKK